MLGAYVDGTLDDRARGEVEAHVADCEECYELLAELLRREEEVDKGGLGTANLTPPTPARVVPFMGRRWVLGGAGILAAAAAVVLVVRLIGPGDTATDERFAKLVAAIGEERPFEARVTGGFRFGPLQSAQRSPTQSNNLALLGAAGELQLRAEADPTAENLHAYGVALLLLGRVDEAVLHLERSVASRPSAAGFSDLAAAYLARGDREGAAEDWARALDAAANSVNRSGELIEPAFNRALALERLGLVEEAAKAYGALSASEPDASWRREIERKAAHLSAQVTKPQGQSSAPGSQNPARTAASYGELALRQRFEGDLLSEWAQAWARGDRTASAVLVHTLRSTANELQAVGDHLPHDTVRSIEQAASASSRADLLSSGHLAFARARAELQAERFANARPHLLAAERALNEARSPFVWWARQELAAVTYYERKNDEALHLLDRVEAAARAGSYLAVVGKCLRLRGQIAAARGEYTAAEQANAEVVEIFGRLGEVSEVAEAHELQVALYYYLGDHHRAWQHLRESSMRVPYLHDDRRQYVRYSLASALAHAGDLTHAASELQSAVITSARRLGRAHYIAEALLQHARLRAAVLDHGSARRDLQLARSTVDAIADPSLRERFSQLVRSTEAETLRHAAPAEAIDAASEVLANLNQTKESLRSAELRLHRADANEVLGNTDDAIADLRAGIDDFEREWSATGQESRISLSDKRWELFERYIELGLRGPTRAADLFHVAERARARTLTERQQIQVPGLLELQQRLPERMAAAAFVQLPSRLLCWLVTRDRTEFFERPISRNELKAVVSAHVEEVRAGAPSTASATIRDAVLGPVLELAHTYDSLVIIPDDALSEVVFPALKHPVTGRYLVESVALSLSPSAGYLTRSLERSRSGQERISRLFAVANPTRTDQLPLPGSVREVQSIVPLYEQATVLSGNDATRERLIESIAGHHAVHIAVHTEVNPRYPMLSRILLSGAGETGVVYARDIAALSLSDLRVVVLASCDSAGGPQLRGEGVISLSRAFLLAGAQSVIGTRWPISDQHLSSFFVALHEQLRAGLAPAEALRQAQLRAVREPIARQGTDWASVVVIGL